MFVVTPWTSPLDLPWLDRLGDVVDAVLADSARLSTGDARALWRRAAASGDTRYGDVQWESLGGWRRAIAFWFDRPGGSGTPSGIRTVIIAAADTGGGRHQGLLLAGWLGSRLGWEPVSGSGGELLRFTMRSGTSDVPVEIRPVPAAGDPSLLRSVTLGIAGAPGPVRWRRPAGEDALVVEAGEDRQFRLTRTQASPAATLLGFLRRSGPDPVAAAALRLAERLGGMAE
jgi:glucose-6-phosphate dehydrogenase assembly protein OpcA